MPVLAAAQTDIPSSSRSREAIDRVKPDLEKELERKDLKYGDPIYIRIFKEEKELEVWIKKENGFDLFKKYDVCTYGSGTLGPKIEEGDGQAPEGFYYVTPDRLNPVSNFHLSFDIGYPNKYDRSQKRTGCDIMVHGSCVSIGCFAMTDKNIEEIFALVDAAFRNGQSFFRIHIFPFRMTKENMENYKDSEWYSFWGNLKEGYDFFEKNGKTPPNVEVSEGRYVFNLNNACFS
ncbi:MAG: murein L,D-transpeptidase [Candidatus Aminicenantes bacterium]|nr:murein L,D-transpeptidase [Candidatus Aminicenantes bacterium]